MDRNLGDVLKLLTGPLTLMSIAGFGFACGALGFAALPAPPPEFVPPERAPALEPVILTDQTQPQTWPAVFGIVPDDPPEPVEQVIDDAPPPPPEENTTYWLTGIVAVPNGKSFAMISENNRGVVVRVGDVLVGGETVTGIDASGVWISYQGETQLIPLPKTDLEGLVTRPAPTPDPADAPPIGQDMTLVVESTDRDYIASLLADAARLEMLESGLSLVSVQQGQIFAQLGLQSGDLIVKVNGTEVSAETGGDLLSHVTGDPAFLEFEIQRGAARQTVKVSFDKI